MQLRKKLLPAFLSGILFAGGINIHALEPTDVIADGLFHLVDFEIGRAHV